MRRAAISVDLDPVAGDELYERAVPRFLERFERFGVHATFFAVGSETRRASARACLRRIAEAGHEVANHSLDHPRGFGQLDDATQSAQIAEAEARLADVVDAPIRGFRAPGWDIDARALRTLEARGYLYDSSVCPSWAAPLGLGLSLALGRGHVFGDARVAFAPAAPYHPSASAPWQRGELALYEVPTSASVGRIPFWFTMVLPTGRALIRVLDPLVKAHPAPQWLFHGIDLLDFEHETDPVHAWRPGLRRPLGDKLALLDEILRRLTRDFCVGTTTALASDG